MRGPLLLSLLLLAACADEPPRRVELATFHFDRMQEREPFGLIPEPHLGLHALLEGWKTPQPDTKALWTDGERARVRLRTLGRELLLRIRCATGPGQAAAGQDAPRPLGRPARR